jgi:hypothetical protein
MDRRSFSKALAAAMTGKVTTPTMARGNDAAPSLGPSPVDPALRSVSSGHSSIAVNAPAAAAAAGYTTRTFGPKVTVGLTWKKFNFYGVDPSKVDAIQNADGSVTIKGSANDYGAQLCSASVRAGRLQGIAFGGGGYFEAVMSFDGPASFWANDIETMYGASTGAGPHHWPGQVAGYGNWIEVDMAEFDTTGVYGFAIHNWYRSIGSGSDINTGPLSGSPVFPAGADYTKPNKYGFLWVPATARSKGYARFYFNDTSIGNTITWNKYDPAVGPAPSVSKGTAFSVLDTLHLALILGSGKNSPNTIHFVSVWQTSSANNILR